MTCTASRAVAHAVGSRCRRGPHGQRLSPYSLPERGLERIELLEPRTRLVARGIGFGIGAALYGAITLKGGKVEQSNFHDYQVLRIEDMPVVEVHIVPSTEKPTGVGEPGVPPIGPALSNALFAATGKRFRALPFAAGIDT